MIRFCFVAVMVACGGGGSPQPDDAPLAADDAAIDAVTACSTPGECPCFSNEDCPAGTRCHAAAPDDVYCEPGPRGTAAPGETCTTENDCDSALCVEGTDTFRCSRTCTDPSQCPAELPRCLAGIGICARQP
jgi:hypothetical protein